MATRRNILSQSERSLWRDVVLVDLGREGRTRSIDRRIERATDLADLAVRAYRARAITWGRS